MSGVWGPRLPRQMHLESQLTLDAGNAGWYTPPSNSGNRDAELRKPTARGSPVVLSTHSACPSTLRTHFPHGCRAAAAALVSKCHSHTESHQAALSAGFTGNQGCWLSQLPARVPGPASLPAAGPQCWYQPMQLLGCGVLQSYGLPPYAFSAKLEVKKKHVKFLMAVPKGTVSEDNINRESQRKFSSHKLFPRG